jgi:8-oxo-dGTP pyrophosphatase MutT (NUDIX family)
MTSAAFPATKAAPRAAFLLSPYADRMKPALIRDPRVVPVSGTDHHLPAVPPERLTLDSVRQRVLAPSPWEPEFGGDGHRFNTERAPAAASVLIALVDRPQGLQVLLTRRTDHLRDHAGQISFAGGRREASDADAVATALREAEEEIGLHARHVQVLGQLPSYTTVTAYVVTPVVALVRPPFELALDAGEVAEAFEVPLAFLMNPAHHHRHAYEVGEVKRHFLSMPWQGPGADGVQREYFIWGATAAMLRNVYRLLAA